MATNSVTLDIGDGWMLTTISKKKVCYSMDLMVRNRLVPPVVLDIILQTKNLVGRFLGRKCQLAYNKRKRREADQNGWKKRSIFFTLPY